MFAFVEGTCIVPDQKFCAAGHMSETETKKYERIEAPGIRAFLAAGDALYPADAVNFTISEQRAFSNRTCAHFRKPRPASIEMKHFRFGLVPCDDACKATTVAAIITAACASLAQRGQLLSGD